MLRHIQALHPVNEEDTTEDEESVANDIVTDNSTDNNEDTDDDKEDMRTTRGVHQRLGVQNLDHIARRNQKDDVRDARNEISSRRCKQVNNQTEDQF